MTKKSLLLIAPLLLLAREPSAFDAGNLDLENPYGLTQSEKVTLQNRNTIRQMDTQLQELNLRVKSLSRKLQEYEEKISGILSVVDGASKGTHDQMVLMQERIEGLIVQNQELNQKYNELQTKQSEDAQRFKSAITELGEIINNINKDYVDRERFRKLEDAFFELEKVATSAPKHNLGDDNWQIYVDMQEHFAKKRYDEVEIRAKHLISENFRRATANYFLGRVNFEKKRYEDAIYYFKESWSIYDKSDFMPILLLQSAISLEKLGKKSEANSFYQSLIDTYPDSDEAEQAKQKLKENDDS